MTIALFAGDARHTLESPRIVATMSSVRAFWHSRHTTHNTNRHTKCSESKARELEANDAATTTITIVIIIMMRRRSLRRESKQASKSDASLLHFKKSKT